MRDQEIVDLWEAYHSIYSNIDEVICKEGGMKEEVELDEDAPKRVDVRPASPRLMRNAGPARVHDPSKPSASKMVKRVDEQTDLFDYILEHLVAEGYADTEESALVIMANMSEDWRQSILSEDPVQDFRDRERAKENAAGMRGPELSHSSKGSKSPGSATQKPQPRSREFTKPPS